MKIKLHRSQPNHDLTQGAQPSSASAGKATSSQTGKRKYNSDERVGQSTTASSVALAPLKVKLSKRPKVDSSQAPAQPSVQNNQPLSTHSHQTSLNNFVAEPAVPSLPLTSTEWQPANQLLSASLPSVQHQPAGNSAHAPKLHKNLNAAQRGKQHLERAKKQQLKAQHREHKRQDKERRRKDAELHRRSEELRKRDHAEPVAQPSNAVGANGAAPGKAPTFSISLDGKSGFKSLKITLGGSKAKVQLASKDVSPGPSKPAAPAVQQQPEVKSDRKLRKSSLRKPSLDATAIAQDNGLPKTPITDASDAAPAIKDSVEAKPTPSASADVIKAEDITEVSMDTDAKHEEGADAMIADINSLPDVLPTVAAMKLLIDRVARRDRNDIFKHPVTDAVAPGYSNIIKKPMDFTTIRKKLDAGSYTDWDVLGEDITLMFDNAMTYNLPETIFYKQAENLKLLSKDFIKLARKGQLEKRGRTASILRSFQRKEALVEQQERLQLKIKDRSERRKDKHVRIDKAALQENIPPVVKEPRGSGRSSVRYDDKRPLIFDENARRSYRSRAPPRIAAWGGLAGGTNTDGILFLSGKPCLIQNSFGTLPLDAYSRSAAAFARNLKGKARELVLNRATECYLLEPPPVSPAAAQPSAAAVQPHVAAQPGVVQARAGQPKAPAVQQPRSVAMSGAAGQPMAAAAPQNRQTFASRSTTPTGDFTPPATQPAAANWASTFNTQRLLQTALQPNFTASAPLGGLPRLNPALNLSNLNALALRNAAMNTQPNIRNLLLQQPQLATLQQQFQRQQQFGGTSTAFGGSAMPSQLNTSAALSGFGATGAAQPSADTSSLGNLGVGGLNQQALSGLMGLNGLNLPSMLSALSGGQSASASNPSPLSGVNPLLQNLLLSNLGALMSSSNASTLSSQPTPAAPAMQPSNALNPLAALLSNPGLANLTAAMQQPTAVSAPPAGPPP